MTAAGRARATAWSSTHARLWLHRVANERVIEIAMQLAL